MQAFGINVPRMITLTYGFGVGLAALAGVLAAPIYSVNPVMGANLIIVVFAVVVIGGMGSIMGSILTGFGLGVVEGLTKVFYPEASNTVIFIIMAIVLMLRPAGPVRNAEVEGAMQSPRPIGTMQVLRRPWWRSGWWRRSFVYPVFLMKVLCFALFACAFNLLIGYVGLLSFGHAMFFGFAAYVSGYMPVHRCWAGRSEARHPAPARARGRGCCCGLVVGAIAIRRQGIYFAMVTLALAQMVFFFCLQAKFTGGEDGIQAIPRRPLFGVLDADQRLRLLLRRAGDLRASAS